MRIAIIGCGAMGTILGAYLAKNGKTVEMIDNNAYHVNKMREDGAKVIGYDNFQVPVNAILPSEMRGIYDIVFLFTKQTSNHIVLPHLLNYIDENSVVCTLQNGVPETAVSEIIGKERTTGGTTNWSATFVEPGISELTQDLEKTPYLFEIGEIDGKITDRINTIAEILGTMGKPTKISTELMASRWSKVVLNACVSGMSAVCGITFGEVLDNDKSRACAIHIGYEVKKACEAEGYNLPLFNGKYSLDGLALENQEMFEEVQRLFIDLYSIVKGGKASMLQDLEKGMVTEVTMINGHVSKTGAKYGIPTPFNNKVVEIVQKIEKGEITYSLDNLNFFDDGLFKFAKLSL
ncbi:MAG: ketopantoate reductase family protein [Defluviitaleaceae bacterium]|nr:ketopantoate reductase family protein [Defluviitaleaceae bacterium]